MAIDDSIPPALQRLAPFVGTWHTTGTVIATSAAYTATDIYEWLPGGHFLVHRWDAQMAEGRSQDIKIIGPDASDGAARGHCTMHLFDSTGKTDTMRSIVDGKQVAFAGNGGPLSRCIQRRCNRNASRRRQRGLEALARGRAEASRLTGWIARVATAHHRSGKPFHPTAPARTMRPGAVPSVTRACPSTHLPSLQG